jgi:hypothetical protein
MTTQLEVQAVGGVAPSRAGRTGPLQGRPGPAGGWRGAVKLLGAMAAAAAALLLCAGPVLAQTDPATAERLLRRSGLWTQLEHIGPQVRQGLAEAASQGGSTLGPEDLACLRAAAEAAYDTTRQRSVALRTTARELQPQHLPALTAWYESSTGAAMTRLEEQAAADHRGTEAVVEDGRARLAAMAPERRALIERFMQASRVVDATLSMTLNTVAGVRQGLAGVMAPGTGPSEAETRALLAEQLPRLKPVFEQMLLAASAVAYADAADAQLEAYVAFLRTPAGEHLSDVMQRVLDAVFLDAATELGSRLAPPRGPGA